MRLEGQGLLAAAIVLTSVGIGAVFPGPSGWVGRPAAAPDLGEGVMAVMFWSETCPSCERMRPAWAVLEGSPPAGVEVVDVPLVPGETDVLFLRYGVTDTPTFLVLRDGEVVGRLVGEVGGDDPGAALRKWIESTASAGPGTPPGRRDWTATLVSLPALGVLAALSPCSAPLIAAYAAAGSPRRRRDYVVCLGSSLLGTLALAAALATAASAAAGLVRGLRIAMAAAAVLFGSTTLLSASGTCPLPGRRVRGLLSSGTAAACFAFGLVTLQCGLPLLAGYVALIGSAGEPAVGAVGAILLAAGMSSALTASLYLANRARGLLGGAVGGSPWFERAGGLALVILGIYMLLWG